jgi:hypothetical protein
MGLSKDDYALVREGVWATERGDTITLRNPRGGFKLYAVRLVGSRRPVWVESLSEAKRLRG